MSRETVEKIFKISFAVMCGSYGYLWVTKGAK